MNNAQESDCEIEIDNESITKEITEFDEYKKYLTENFYINIENIRIPCFAHTLQLIVMKSKAIKGLALNLKSMSNKVNKSKNTVKEVIKLCNSRPPSYCPTRCHRYI